MSEDELAIIIDAILNGKYSWACVLILKNAGYEPGHYIPYRTLNRLIKENGFPNCASSNQGQDRKSHPRRSTKREANHASARRIRDLNYMDLSVNDAKKVKGGHFAAWTNTQAEIDSMSGRSAWAF
ncbi:HetP family heterocyst commitment protein [Leptothoe spongobia]